MDEEIRQLERQSASGDSEATERLEKMQERIKEPPPPEPAWKIRWRKIGKACDKLKALVEKQGYPFVTHDAHGFYIDAAINGKRYMLDPTPDTIYENGIPVKSYPPGVVIIRDSTHHYSKPTQLAEFNIMDDPEGLQLLEEFFNTL